MSGARETNDEQIALWNGSGGRAWVDVQEILDPLFEPLEHLLVEAVATGPARRILDVGCGTGATTLAMARALGDAGDCTGIDVSEPMVELARSRAAQDDVSARFIVADAQLHPFEPESFDMITSRFGVMFFGDLVEAFENLHVATEQGGSLRLIVWRSAAENPFMTTAARAAAPFVTIPTPQPDAPGQFSLADAQRMRAVLEESGWHGIDVQPIDVDCTMPEEGLATYLTRLGPLGRALADEEATTKNRIVEAVRPAFDPYVDGTEVRFTAACWMVGASA